MRVGARIFLVCGFSTLLVLAGCGRSMFQGERAAWRSQAEAQCMKSGAVKIGVGVVQIDPIEGPGMCGADLPLKVSALGESAAALGYSDIPRPPGGVGSSSSMPDWPASRPRTAPDTYQPNYQSAPQPSSGGQMRWVPGPPPIDAPETASPQTYRAPAGNQPGYETPRYETPRYEAPRYEPSSAPARAPMSIYPPGVTTPSDDAADDIPDDAELPQGRASAPPQQTYSPQPQSSYTPPPLGPSRDPKFGPMNGPQATGPIMAATLTPAATLSCPIVSALDRWVGEGVQPAALHWFGSPVTEIKQISAYSCRQMNGAGGHGISEHAFGNALDIAAFTLADGRKISVQHGWRGTPEEQGFLHDVQLYACETFTTVLAPGYNAAHYNHIHVDLMRRASGRRPCRPNAIKGEVVAAKARAVYASKHGGNPYTGSIGGKSATEKTGANAPTAVPGADGLDDDADEAVIKAFGKVDLRKTEPAKSASAKSSADDSDFNDDDMTASIGAGPQTGWPRLAPQRSRAAKSPTTTKSPADF